MMIISIRQTSPGRLTVGFDDGTEIKSTLGTVTDLRLFSGKELDDDTFEALRINSARSIARERALEIVSRRLMSRKEVYDKLLLNGVDADTAEYCVGWLEKNGFINEENYAAAVARHYALKAYGAGRVKAELSRRGIERELWDDALSSMPESDEKLDRFIASRLTDPEDREQIRKISSSLYRRGYSWDEIRSAMARYSIQKEDY